MDSGDNAVHSNGDIKITGGAFSLRAGDDTVHADSHLKVAGGQIAISESYEGLEGLSIDINDGIISIVSSDDGINAAGGVDFSGNRGRGDDPFAVTQGAYIRIAGGEIKINASGDGIDSNGDFFLEGGVLSVEGPSDRGNGILDYNGTGMISGGTLAGTGNAGMLQTFSEDSPQPVLIRFFENEKDGGTAFTAADSSGKKLIEYTPEKKYSVLIFSSPNLAEGEAYQITAGEETAEVQLEGAITYSGSQPAGGRMGMPGGLPEGHRRPGDNFKRLCQVIISTGIQPADPVRYFRAGSQHQDRRSDAGGPKLP